MMTYSQFLGSVAWFIEAKTIVEIGVAKGSTSLHLAKTAQFNNGQYIGFDLWGQHGQISQFQQLGSKSEVDNLLKQNNISCYNLVQIDTINQKHEFEAVLDMLCPNGIDFAFIDGCHSYKGIASDFTTVYPRLSNCGMIAFHDTARIDGCREFLLDLRTKYYDGSFDIIDLPFGEDRHCGVSILAKRMYPLSEWSIDEVCGSISDPKVIEQNEIEWLNSETANKAQSHKLIPSDIIIKLDKIGFYDRKKLS